MPEPPNTPEPPKITDEKPEMNPREHSMFAVFGNLFDFSNDADVGRVTLFSFVFLGLGLVFIVCYGGFSKASASWLLGAGGFFAVGITIGFMFGLPKIKHEEVNTNLEQISDWLTKILVGVGLTQLTNIPAALASLAEFVAGGKNCSCHDRSVAFFVIFYFFFGGLVCGYLETRVYLARAFTRALTSKQLPKPVPEVNRPVSGEVGRADEPPPQSPTQADPL